MDAVVNASTHVLSNSIENAYFFIHTVNGVIVEVNNDNVKCTLTEMQTHIRTVHLDRKAISHFESE